MDKIPPEKVREIEDAVNWYRGGSGWISVKDRLPETNNKVLCLDVNKCQFTGSYTNGGEIEYWDDEDDSGEETLYLKPGWYECEEQIRSDYDEYWFSRNVTHWMPLPEPPKISN